MPVPNFEKLKADSIKNLRDLIAKTEDPDEKVELEAILKKTRDMEDAPYPDPADCWYGASN